MKINLVYKYPLKTSPAQGLILYRWSSGCRYLWNRSLRLKKRLYDRYKVDISYFSRNVGGEKTKEGLSKRLTKLRGRYDWLSECPNCCQQGILRDLDKSYQNFYRRVKRGETPGYPRFKRGSELPRLYFTKNNITLSVHGNRAYIKLPKIPALRIFYNRPALESPTDVLQSVSLVYERERWYVCILVQKELEIPHRSPSPAVGIDMGITKTYTLSDGTIYNMDIDRIKKLESRKAVLERRLSRKIGSKKGQKKSKNWLEQRKRINKICHQIADIRKNFNHHTSKEIVDNYGTIVVENLKISNMSRSTKGTVEEHGSMVKQKSALNRSILRQGWRQFRVMLEYKSGWRGGTVIGVPPQYTSQMCSVCGYVDSKNRCTQASFKCVSCGHTENADVNASKNILNKALAGSPG